MIPSGRQALRAVTEGAAHFIRSHGFVYSAAIAFNLLLASIPVLFLAFSAASLLIGRDDLPFSVLASILKDTFPYGAQVLVPNLRKLFASGATFGYLGTLLLLVTSYSATDAVHTSLAVMMGSPRDKRIWRTAAYHVALVLVLTVFASAAIVIPPFWKGLSLLTRGLSAGWDTAFHLLLGGIADAVLAGILFTAGVLSYMYLSPRRIKLENAMAGSLAFLLFLYGIRFGFTFYVKKFSKLNIIYGSLFSIVCFIIVAYLFSAAYLFCASIIGTLEKTTGNDEPSVGD
ncbi:MAG: YihY/virulence factor BrkB family protein [Deltaproteobacteria bacterium]|nr:YihY/virulence factor BrkB family protein [Deltaproteobacteria bacterium]